MSAERGTGAWGNPRVGRCLLLLNQGGFFNVTRTVPSSSLDSLLASTLHRLSSQQGLMKDLSGSLSHFFFSINLSCYRSFPPSIFVSLSAFLSLCLSVCPPPPISPMLALIGFALTPEIRAHSNKLSEETSLSSLIPPSVTPLSLLNVLICQPGWSLMLQH